MDSLNWNALNGTDLLHAVEQYCTSIGASDVHCSPEEKDVRIEVRLHGVLTQLCRLSRATYLELTRRLKFVAKLKLNITNIPQDGQYTFLYNELKKAVEAPSTDKETPAQAKPRKISVRVATIPAHFGEAFTLRLLDPQRGIVPLEQLGFSQSMEGELRQLAQLPNGLILVTGPTGSGKTTTLYALIQQLVGTARHIVTLEDPVEYELPGIVQSQIDPDHNYTFSSGLRSILRHDPNVILVGEIRDFETAQTAIDAALTGHLVFSTLHTNSAIEAIPRLLSMGVTPYTFAPALRAVLAQRLVRTLKTEWRGKENLDCSSGTVYDGRTTIAELLKISPAIQDLILLSETASSIESKARSEGFISMREYGDVLIKSNLTTLAEVLRVCH